MASARRSLPPPCARSRPGGEIAWERATPAPARSRSTAIRCRRRRSSRSAEPLALKGPLATPSGGGYRSVNVTLRQQFDLYANVRPARTIAGALPLHNVDLIIVRENTEDLYAGVEHYIDPRARAAESIAIITRFGSERVIVYAFEYARRMGRKKVTLVHKANILKMSNGLFLDTGREVAKRYPDIAFDDMIVDATAMKLVARRAVRRDRHDEPVRRHPVGSHGGPDRRPRRRARGEHRRRRRRDVRGGARHRARHRGRASRIRRPLMLSGAVMLDHVGQRSAAQGSEGRAGTRLGQGAT